MSTPFHMQSDPTAIVTSTAKSMMMGILHSGGTTEIVDVKPCSPPLVYYLYSPTGWNAVLVGLLSAMLALIFMMICLYYLGRRRIEQLVMTVDSEKGGQSAMQTTSTSQTTTAIMVNENGKEMDRTTKINSYQEQSGIGSGEFIPLTNGGAGHTNLQMTNGDLAGLHQTLGYGHGESNKESETRLLSEHQ